MYVRWVADVHIWRHIHTNDNSRKTFHVSCDTQKERDREWKKDTVIHFWQSRKKGDEPKRASKRERREKKRKVIREKVFRKFCHENSVWLFFCWKACFEWTKDERDRKFFPFVSFLLFFARSFVYIVAHFVHVSSRRSSSSSSWCSSFSLLSHTLASYVKVRYQRLSSPPLLVVSL